MKITQECKKTLQRPFLEDEDGAHDDPDDSTYAPSDGEDSKNGDYNDNNNKNINLPLTKKWDRGRRSDETKYRSALPECRSTPI